MIRVSVFLILILFSRLLSGQCPERSFLYNRIIFLRDSSSVSTKDQLDELLKFSSKIEQCDYKNDSTHALLLARIGWLYSTQKDFINAVDFTKASIRIIADGVGKRDVNPVHVVKSYNNLRIFYDSLHQFDLQLAAIDSCILNSIANKGGYYYSLPLLYWRTKYLFEIGDYYRCIQYADLGINVAATGNESAQVKFFYTLSKINALIFLKKYELAEKLAASSIEDAKKSDIKTDLGVLYNLLSVISNEKNETERALIYAKKAVVLDISTKNFVDCAAALNNTGWNIYFLKLRHYEQALAYFQTALKYADTGESINILGNIANLYVARKMFDSAFLFFESALYKIQSNADESLIFEKLISGFYADFKIEYIINLVLDRADAYLAMYKYIGDKTGLKKAIEKYKVVDEFMTRSGKIQTESSSKLFWRSAVWRLYDHAIEASYLNSDVESGFYFLEKGKAVLLKEQVNEKLLLKESDIITLGKLRKKIFQLDSSNNSGESNIGASDAQQTLFIERQRLNKLENRLKKDFSFESINDSDMKFASLQFSQKKLLARYDMILQLFNGDSAVYAMLITKNNVSFYQINKLNFDKISLSYMSFLSNPGMMNNDFSGYVETASKLYSLIFQSKSLPSGRIVILPDGKFFPFESLVTSRPGEPVKFLLEDHPVSYAYSARFLLSDLSEKSTDAGESFLGVAPVNYPASFSLASLAGSEQSLKNIAENFSSSFNYVSANASRNNFMQDFSKYKIIQLYTHAAENSKNNEPVIYFADSLLYLSDLIGETKPLTKLIVLSACETGLGKEYKGEGVFSFNRGFAALGIPSSVTNLWTIDNESTYKITELFYKYIADGLPLDEALQKAKIDFIKTSSKEKRLPYYWAAAVLVGNSDAIIIQKNRNWPLYIITIGVPVLIFILFLAIRKRKRLIPVRDTMETGS